MYPKKKSGVAAEKLDLQHTETPFQTTSQSNSHPHESHPKPVNISNAISVNLLATSCDCNAALAPPHSRHQYHHHTTSSIGVGSYHSCWSVPSSPLTGRGMQANSAGCIAASVHNPLNCTVDGAAFGVCSSSPGGAEGVAVDSCFLNSHHVMHPNSSVTSMSYPIPPPNYYNNAVSGGVNANSSYYGYDAGQPHVYPNGPDVLPLPPQSPTRGNTSPSSHSGVGQFSPPNDAAAPALPAFWNNQIQQAEARYKHLYEEFQKLSRSRLDMAENLSCMRREQQTLQEGLDFYRTKAVTVATEKAEVMKAYLSDITMLLAILDRLTGELVGLRRSIHSSGSEAGREIDLAAPQAGSEALIGKECSSYADASKQPRTTHLSSPLTIGEHGVAVDKGEKSIARELYPKFIELRRVLKQLEEDLAKSPFPVQGRADLGEGRANNGGEPESDSGSTKGTGKMDNCSHPKADYTNACLISYPSFRWLLNVLHLSYEQYDSAVSLASQISLQRGNKDDKGEKTSSTGKYEGSGVNSSSVSIENDKDSRNHSRDNTPRRDNEILLQGNLQNIIAAAHRDMKALLKSMDYGFPMNSSGCCGLKLQLQLPQWPSAVLPQPHLANSKNSGINMCGKSNPNRLNSESLSEGEAAPSDILPNNHSGVIFPVLKTF